MAQTIGFELRNGGANEILLRVRSAVAPGYDRVLRLEDDVPVAVDEERAERVVAVLTGVSGQLDRPRQMAQLLVRHHRSILSGAAPARAVRGPGRG